MRRVLAAAGLLAAACSEQPPRYGGPSDAPETTATNAAARVGPARGEVEPAQAETGGVGSVGGSLRGEVSALAADAGSLDRASPTWAR